MSTAKNWNNLCCKGIENKIFHNIYKTRPLQMVIICSNSRLEENLIPQLPFGNEDVKFFDNEEVG